MCRRKLLLASIAIVLCADLVACTKANPAKYCDTGTCIDPAYPYCDVTGAIGGEPGTCIAVTCTPGTVGSCAGTNGLVCNANGNSYDEAPCSIRCDVSSNTCLDKCTNHTQCDSGICKPDRSCAAESEIVYTEPNAGRYTDCSQSTPCALARALELVPPTQGQYIKLAAGSYVDDTTLTVTGRRYLVGRGAETTTLSNATTGSVFVLALGSDVTFDSLRIANALTPVSAPTSMDMGWGLFGESAGPRSLHVTDVIFSNNGNTNGGGGGGIDVQGVIDIRRTEFNGNYSGAYLSGEITIDQCMFVSNSTTGLFANLNWSVTNSFFVRNGEGAFIQGASTTPVFAFNTVADNVQSGVTCEASSVPTSCDNNIIARNGTNTGSASSCSFSNSLIATDLTNLHFSNPDTAPYSYHLSTGSVAIDAASGSTPHDFDGDARPKGNASDLGADEAF